MKTKYIITDPCYLLSSNDWFNLFHDIDLCAGSGRNEFNTRIKHLLEKLTGATAWVEHTGYGDWSNVIFGNVFDGRSDFCADSATVCVCKYTSEFEEINIVDWSAAIIEAEGEITVEMDTSDPSWTVVSIKDEAGNSWRTLKHGEA